MRVLLSIKPEFAERILSGEKKFEFRRVIHSNKNVDSVIIYVTAPVQRMVGEFKIDQIIADRPEVIWEKTSRYAGISREKYDEYFFGKAQGFALGVGIVTKYVIPIDPKSIMPMFTPPQSFMYFPENLFNDENNLGRQLGLEFI